MTKWYESFHIWYKTYYIWDLIPENLWAKIYDEQNFSATRLFSFYGLCIIYDVIFVKYFTYFVSVIRIPSILYGKIGYMVNYIYNSCPWIWSKVSFSNESDYDIVDRIFMNM